MSGTSPTRYDLDRDDLVEVLADHPRYRVDQLWTGLYGEDLDIDQITTLPKALRATLSERLPPSLRVHTEQTSDDGDTRKWLFLLEDGDTIETVLMHYPDRATVCVSSQAGCAMACGFCSTGQQGFRRQLTTGEIVEQVVRARRAARPRRLSNVVFMGMGEPLANYDNTWSAIRRIHGAMGLSARHITMSTVGHVPGIRRMATEGLPISLAVSLHAATDDLRSDLVPLNRTYGLDAVEDACRHYVERTGRRVSIEWAMIAGVNDTDEQATALARRCRRLRAHVNLIPLNPTPGYVTVGSSPDRVRAFQRLLADHGINATVRRNRGTDIDAACGQLRSRRSDDTGSPVPAPTRR